MSSHTSLDNTIKSSIAKPAYRVEIDGLRALAVVAVIINHFDKDLLPSGYLGVDIFFVISGFVITSSLASRSSNSFGDFLVGFYTRRIKRLVPALIVFVLPLSFFICLLNPTPKVTLATGLYSLFGLSNLYLLGQATDYFADSTGMNVFTHTWSLGVEEQFYVLFPVLAWLTGFSRSSKRGSRNLFWAVGGLSIASLIGFISLYESNQSAAYFLMPTRLWELGAGCLLFLGLRFSDRFSQALKKVPSWAVTIALVSVLFAPLQFAVLATLAVVLLTAVLITCLRPETLGYAFFTRPSIVYIGVISYSLYLWHWGVLSISRWTIGIHAWTVPWQVALMLLLATASYRYVETPLRRSDWSPVRWRTIGYGVGALVIAAVFVRGISSERVHAPLFLDKPAFASRAQIIAPKDPFWNQERCTTHSGSTQLIEDNFDSCNITGVAANPSKKRIFWYGDSYADQLSLVLSAIATEEQLPINLFTARSCPASQSASFKKETETGYCSKAFRKYLAYFSKNSRVGDVLVLNNSFGYWEPGNFQIDPKGRANFQEGQAAFKQYFQELSQLSDDLKRKGRKLALVSDIPMLHKDPNLCAYWFTRWNTTCSSGALIDFKPYEYRRSISSTIQNDTHFNQGEFLDIYTPSKELLLRNRDQYADNYRNKGHLSKTGALHLKKDILTFLRQNQLLG